MGPNRPAPQTPKELGIYGERVAEEHLVNLGYRILDRNWRWRKGEMDLITEQGDVPPDYVPTFMLVPLLETGKVER